MLAKFVEKGYQKIERLVQLRREYATKVTVVDEEIKAEKAGIDSKELADLEDEWLSRRLDAGLFCLQVIMT